MDNHSHSFFSHFHSTSRNNFFLIIIALVVGIVIGYLFTNHNKSSQTISLIGKADIAVQADMATISWTLDTSAPTEKQSIADNNKDLANIKTKLASIGIPTSNIKVTDTYTEEAYPDEYEDSPAIPLSSRAMIPTPTVVCLGESCSSGGGGGGGSSSVTYSEPTSYTTVTEFTVVLKNKDINKEDQVTQTIFDSATSKSNSLSIDYTTYSLMDRQGYDIKLKEKAVTHAKEQAESLAKLSNLTVKKILSIQEQDTPEESFEDPYDEYYSDEQTTKEMTLRASYKITYELGPKLFPF